MTGALVVIASAIVSLIATRLIRSIALSIGLVDSPDGIRKLHRNPIPVGGGVAVLLTMFLVIPFAIFLDPDCRTEFISSSRAWYSFFLSLAIIVGVGMIDDRIQLRARHKLLGQILASSVLIFGGNVIITNIHLLGYEIALGLLAYPVTYLWLLAAVNALNLLDGMDGLLGAVGVIGCSAFALVALLAGNPLAAVVAFALAGGLLGFLRYNLPPASIYCGDAGSMLVGMTVGALAILGSMKSQALALGIPASILVLPLLDTTAAIVRRRLRGKGVFIGDSEHLHHNLQRLGMSVPEALLLVCALGCLAATGAVAGQYFHLDILAMITAAGVIGILLVTGLFGITEVRLLQKHARGMVVLTRSKLQSIRSKVQVNEAAHLPDISPMSQQ